MLGPSLFGHLLPDWYETTFANSDITDTGLRMTYQLGLILLMYCSGAQLRSILSKSEGRPVAAISIIGSVLPVGGLVLVLNWDGANRFIGSANDRVALRWFALAMAVTSIPVISRIMADLNLLGTRFSRVVLSVAVLEDVAVYVLLNIVVAGGHWRSARYGLPGILDLGATSGGGQAYHVVVTLAFFLIPLLLGPAFVARLASWRGT